MGPNTVSVLRWHEAEEKLAARVLNPAYQDDGVVFATVRGSWLNLMKLARALQALGRRVGLPNLTARSLRHTHVSIVLQQGANIVVVSKRLGHSKMLIT